MAVTRLCFDYDYMKYSIASVCEKRTIIATHKKSGNQKEFDTRTDFWGHWKKKDGGWLGALNKERTEQGKEPFSWEDFDIEDKQVAQPVSHMNQVVKGHIQGVCNAVGASSYYGYIGKGDSWRVEASTILKYKGQRVDQLKPLMLEEIEDYLKRHHSAEIVTGLEADDQVIIDATKNPKLVVIGVDKDYNGCEPIWLFNPDTMKEPLRIEGLGKLWIDDKGKVRGMGRKFFYFQVLAGDDSDNYCANSASDMKWADKSAFKVLDPCQTDRDCWEGLVASYQKLYPEKKEILGWRGEKLTIDAKYVLAENCTMAYMLRSPDGLFELDTVLEGYGLTF